MSLKFLAVCLSILGPCGPPALVWSAVSSRPVVLVRKGESIGGVGHVTQFVNLAVNDSGDWIVQADTDADGSMDEVILRASGLYLHESQTLPEPPGAALSSIGAVNLNDAGHSGWNFSLRNEPSNTDSGIYLDTHLLLRENDVSRAPQFSPATRYLGFLDAKIDDENRIAAVATVDDPNIPTVLDRALVVLEPDGSGNLASERVVAKEGDHLPGQIQTVVDFGPGPHQTAWRNGRLLFFADLTGNVTRDGVIYLDSRKIAQEGDPSPEPGEPYFLLSGRGLDVNDAGEVAFRANLGGDPLVDEAIFVEGRRLVRERQSLPMIAPFLLTGIGTPSGPLPMDDDRNVLWFGDWNSPELDKDTGLFLGDVLVVEESTPVEDGHSIASFGSGENAFALSRNGRYIVFDAVLDDGTEEVLEVEVHAPAPVPDGDHVPGSPMKATLGANRADIDVTWDVAGCPAGQYNLFYGDLASVPSLIYTGAVCGIGASGHATFTPPGCSLFFLIASVDESGVEGGHGYDSQGRARDAGAGGLCGVVGQLRSARCPQTLFP